MTETTYAKRPWSAAELASLKRDLASHEPVRNLTYVDCIQRKRARIDLDLEPELLAEMLSISVEDLYSFEDDPKLLSAPENESYRRFICASAFADVLRAPSRLGNWPSADVRKWNRAKHVPSNPLPERDEDAKVMG